MVYQLGEMKVAAYLWENNGKKDNERDKENSTHELNLISMLSCMIIHVYFYRSYFENGLASRSRAVVNTP